MIQHVNLTRNAKTAVKNVLQTTSSAFSNKQNITDETCCVYRWSFPLSFSHLLWLCHHEPLGWSKNKSRLHKSPPPHVRCTWMQSSIVARLFTFIVFFCLFFLQIELQLKKKRLLTHQLYHHTAVVLSVNCQHAICSGLRHFIQYMLHCCLVTRTTCAEQPTPVKFTDMVITACKVNQSTSRTANPPTKSSLYFLMFLIVYRENYIIPGCPDLLLSERSSTRSSQSGSLPFLPQQWPWGDNTRLGEMLFAVKKLRYRGKQSVTLNMWKWQRRPLFALWQKWEWIHTVNEQRWNKARQGRIYQEEQVCS